MAAERLNSRCREKVYHIAHAGVAPPGAAERGAAARTGTMEARMSDSWMNGIEAAADVLGEMLVEMAEGRGTHDNEDIAAAVLQAGLSVLLESGPDPQRLEEVGRVLYAKLHDGGEQRWEALSEIEKGFWLDLAGSAAAASDAALLQTMQGSVASLG